MTDTGISFGSERAPPALVAGRLVQAIWVGAMGVLGVVAGLGLAAAYRRPELIAIPQFAELMAELELSERLAMTLSFVLPIAASLVLAGVVFIGRRGDGMALLFPLAVLGMFVYGSGAPGALRSTIPQLAPLSAVAEVVALEALAFFLFLFPSGRLQPDWTRFVLIPLATVVAVYPPIATSVRLVVSDPASVPTALRIVTVAAIVSMLVGASISQYVRYRHYTTPIERQQIRWVVLGLAVLVVPVVLMALGVGVLPSRWVGWSMLLASMAGILVPVTAGVAVFRYRLYDIALIVNRTIVYLVLTGFLGLVYGGLVMIVSQLTPAGNDLGVAASTLTVAALFRPARRRIQLFVDARFHRSRYDAAATLEAFGSRLRRQVDLSTLRYELTGTIQRSLEPRHMSLWLADATGAADD
ncbi:MAG TPA: hypothetical protein VLB85_08590 [Acidimicrobiia bacterium]|nr:hypothetical protein [Acidimicrobiia bacterium]